MAPPSAQTEPTVPAAPTTGRSSGAPLDRLLDGYGPRRPGHAGWVLLASGGALGLAWVLPSPDRAIPGLWTAGLVLAVAGGSARWSARLAAPLLLLGFGLGAVVLLGWRAAGGWALAGASAAAIAAGRLGGGPGVLTTGPLWLAARLAGLVKVAERSGGNESAT